MHAAISTERHTPTDLLKSSLDVGRLGHAYLFVGSTLEPLENAALALTKTLNCLEPSVTGKTGLPLDFCGACLPCQKIDSGNSADLTWIRPESKTRIIRMEQVKGLIQKISLKPTEAKWKIAIISAAERLRTEGANAFLKTLEEPPKQTVLILLTTAPESLLETIRSRCLRLNFPGETGVQLEESDTGWLRGFCQMSATRQDGLMGRYRLLDTLLAHLGVKKDVIADDFSERSPLKRHNDIEKTLREKWEKELTASIEAEYKRQRGEVMAGLHWWLRDVWLLANRQDEGLLNFPDLASESRAVAGRISEADATRNMESIESTQRILYHTNTQESLVMEVGLLNLNL